MKQQHIHQELLVFTTTSLSNNVLYETNDSDKNENSSQAELLEQAFWNGLLNELFPEVVSSDLTTSPKMFIWGIYMGNSYLLIDLANMPGTTESVLSIDPQLFVPILNLN